MPKIHSNQSISGREKVGIKNLTSPIAFTDYSQTIDDVYQNLENYNSTKESVKSV